MRPPAPHGVRATILVIDDELPIRRALRRALAPEFKLLEAASAREGIDLAAARQPELIVLDLGLPDGAGLQVCREIRRSSQAPIVVLSARHSERDKVDLLEATADDFVTKPFSTVELLARLRACLRRARALPLRSHAPLAIGDLLVDLDARTLKKQGLPVHLTPVEWGLLRALVLHAGRTLNHAQLSAAIRIEGQVRAPSGQHPLQVHLANLRRKIETDVLHPTLIVTEPGVGYRFELPT